MGLLREPIDRTDAKRLEKGLEACGRPFTNRRIIRSTLLELSAKKIENFEQISEGGSWQITHPSTRWYIEHLCLAFAAVRRNDQFSRSGRKEKQYVQRRWLMCVSMQAVRHFVDDFQI